MLCYYCFFVNEWYLLRNYYWDLNFNSLNFGIVDLYFLVLNTIPVGGNCNFPDDFIGNSPLDLHLHNLFSLDYLLNHSLYLHYLNYLLVDNYWPINEYLHNLLHLLDHNVWNWDLHNLEDGLLHNNDLFNYLRHLDNLFYDARHHNDLLHYPFNFYYSWHLYNFFNYFFDNLFFYSNNFLLNNNWDRVINFNLFDYLLLDRN